MNRLTSEDGQLYACGNGLCSDGDIECANCRYADEAFLKLAEYENTGLEPKEIEKGKTYFTLANRKGSTVGKVIEYAANMKDLEEQGLLIKLPCKVGDTVYFITKELDIVKGISSKVIDEYIVTEIRGNKYNPLWYMSSSERCVHRDFHPTEIGKTVFLTRDEAEKALNKEE